MLCPKLWISKQTIGSCILALKENDDEENFTLLMLIVTDV